jgi:NADH-quinone oxidoreductase subunit L
MNLVYTVVFLPLIAAFISGIFSCTKNKKVLHIVSSTLLVISAVSAAIVFHDVIFEHITYQGTLFRWIYSGNFFSEWAIRVDSLTAVMFVVVTTVSAVVHIYSVGYMHEDPKLNRFMAYLSLFTFFMLLLVSAENLIQLFVGWEGVGLCSYLLIGFWYKKPSATNAAMKAFIVNRVGDFAFMIGLIAIFALFGSIEFSQIFANVAQYKDATLSLLGYEIHYLTFICVMLFIGCMGKSAQIGLHTWLPDAMEGPTPVSALIHAATMVTAGVFLVVRCSALFEYSPFALNMMTIVGGVTCLFAATIAITQNDIKRVIAYSTCSQLGYMFFACGVSAYAGGMFHLVTHAFFKALLFLAAGNVIHAVAHIQDMRKMGGLWRKMPITYAIVWIGSLAIAGIPPFAGYFSKDVILEAAYMSHGQFGHFAFWMGIAAAFLTALYSWRLIIMTFHGKPRYDENVAKHIHEAPYSMNLPLMILVVGAIFAGTIGYKTFGMVDSTYAFWQGSIFVLPENNVLEHIHHTPFLIKILPLIVAIAAIILAYTLYALAPSLPSKIAGRFGRTYRFLHNKWYFDELYEFIFVKGIKNLSLFLWKWIDQNIIDNLGPNGMAFLTGVFAKRVGKIQTGYVYHYAFTMIIGVVLLSAWYLFSQFKI